MLPMVAVILIEMIPPSISPARKALSRYGVKPKRFNTISLVRAIYAKACSNRLPTVLPYHDFGPQVSLYSVGPLLYNL